MTNLAIDWVSQNTTVHYCQNEKYMHSIVYKLFDILDSHWVVLVSSKLEVVIILFILYFCTLQKQIGCSN